MKINWDEKPEWANGHAVINADHVDTYNVWFNDNQYQYLHNGSIYHFTEGWEKNDLTNKQYPPETKPELPLIGSEYTLKPYWHKVLIVAHDAREDGTRIVYWDYSACEYDFNSRSDYFIPIKSDREKWAEKAAELFFKANNGLICDAAFDSLYDALISGELPLPKQEK